MQLSEIFTKKNIEILKLIDQEELHIREIADRLKISPGLVHKLTTILKKQDLIIETRIKNKKLIKFNKENPKIGLIMDIINDTEENTYLKKYKHLLKRRWYIQSFNATPTLIHLGGMSIPIMKKDLGYSYRFFMNNFKEDFCEMYYDRNDLHMIAHEVEDRMMINPEYINKLIQTWKKRCKKMELFIKKNEKHITTINDEELIKKYKNMASQWYETVGTAHIIEGYALTRDIRLKNILLRELEQKKEQQNFNKYFRTLTNPIEKSFINEYNNKITEIYKEIINNQELVNNFKNKKPTEIEEAIKKQEKIWSQLKKIQEEFYWIRASYKDSRKLKIINFIKELKDIITKSEHPKSISDEIFKQNLKDKNELIKKLKLCNTLIDIIKMTDTMTTWQDKRKKYILIGCSGLEMFMEEISKRFNIEHKNLRYLLPEEMSVKKLKSLPEKFYTDRIKGCFVIYEDEQFEVLTNRDYTEFKKALQKQEDGDEIKDIHGMCASMGKVTGKVRICKTMEDLQTFKKGEILVTGMTRPEFVPAMSKAIAVVTDEGGITSHAAVISRELGIPCVIGTKIATKSLKDGDLVEVNANHGIIKIIK